MRLGSLTILFFVLSSILFFSLFNSAYAQIKLQPGIAQFTVSAIFLVNTTPDGQMLSLTGNSTYLNTYWEAYYWNGSQRDIGAVCFLNCDERYNTTCPQPWNCSCSAVQNCSTLTPPGKGVCSITSPNYNLPLTKTNFVGCRIYDPQNPSLVRGNLNKTFTPIDFSAWFSDYSSMVGEEFNFPVNIKNQGLFTDTYQVNAWTNRNDVVKINPQTQLFSIQLHGDSFEPHSWQQLGPEIKQVYIKVTLLDASATQTNLCVNVTSFLEPSDYQPQQSCKQLKSQLKNLPELSLLELMLIAVIASVFIFKLKRRF